MTLKTVKPVLLTLLLIILLAGAIHAKGKNTEPNYVKYAHKITEPFIKECEKEYHLDCIGSGGGFAYNVRAIDINFIAYRKGTIEEARKLEVAMIEKLLNLINTNEKIRPFLAEYPFKPNNISISLAFRKPDNSRYNDGSVVLILVGKNKLLYCSEDPKTGQLTDIMEEPYEEALKIVLGTPPQENQPNAPPTNKTLL